MKIMPFELIPPRPDPYACFPGCPYCDKTMSKRQWDFWVEREPDYYRKGHWLLYFVNKNEKEPIEVSRDEFEEALVNGGDPGMNLFLTDLNPKEDHHKARKIQPKRYKRHCKRYRSENLHRVVAEMI